MLMLFVLVFALRSSIYTTPDLGLAGQQATTKTRSEIEFVFR